MNQVQKRGTQWVQGYTSKIKIPTSGKIGQKWGTHKEPNTACRSLCLLTGQPRRLSLRSVILSAYFFGPGFEVLLYLGHELVGYCAVDQAMVVAQREMDN